jgi:hypothetical protein
VKEIGYRLENSTKMAVPNERWKSQEKAALAKLARLEALDRQFEDLAQQMIWEHCLCRKRCVNWSRNWWWRQQISRTPDAMNVEESEGIQAARN